MAGRKNQGAEKAKAVTQKYFAESGAEDKPDFTKVVNWATAEQVEDLRKPSVEDLFNEIKSKTTEPVSDVEIIIEPEQKRLNLIFRNSLNLRDISNPQLGEEDRSNRKTLQTDILEADPKENKVCVVYAGDLIGTEWELKHLNNAKILEQETKSGRKISKALFFGLNERKKALKNDIEFALSMGVDVYLINGAQEHKVNRYFKIDILEEIKNEINSDKLHYIRGVNTIVNVGKQYKNGRKVYSTIGFQTNNSMSKSSKGQQVVTAVKANSGVNKADQVFVSNTNVAGKKGSNTYFVSGQSRFINTSRGKNPTESPKGFNTFSLNLAGPGEITVLMGSNLPKSNPLEMIVYSEAKRMEYIEKVILENTRKQLAEISKDANNNLNAKVKTLQYFKSKYDKRAEEAVEKEEENAQAEKEM